ncbi:manganese ion transporter [Scheffersomyces amazonensis]|uniref:manganese ion transporter n=1 Tax=Scheffersomyces amazonensis TaxID=1078765 RepID=UPI00315D0C8E
MSLTHILSLLRGPSLVRILKKYAKFIGPGLMVSVAYMDPGNYSTAVAAGSAYQYKLLFSILLSNFLGIFLQILAAKLGAVTGLDLAANCRANLSSRINIFIYILAELAIIATDLAEVVGTAIALNILFNLPLILGVIVTVIDVLIVLMAYRPKGPLLFIRIFESFVSILVFATVICFAIELYQVSNDPSINFNVIDVFKGFLPNEKVIDTDERKGGNGLFLSLAILGATVMPHSLYLGSGLVQARLKDFDVKHGHYKPLSKSKIDESQPLSPPLNPIESPLDDNNLTPLATPYNDTNDPFNNINAISTRMSVRSSLISRVNSRNHDEKDEETTLANIEDEEEEEDTEPYRPSIHAIDETMSYTIVELVISLFTVALFVNAAILIVAGATLNNKNNDYHDDHDHDHDKFKYKFMFKRDDDHDDYDDSDDESFESADLYTIYNLLSKHLSPTAGFVFALALLCSGQSAGVVCTLAGQMVSEGFLAWSLPPVTRRLITRGLAILPCLLVVGLSGREGLAKILNASQVVLAILLPFVTAPLIMFTCSKDIMRVPIFVKDGDEILYDEEVLNEDELGIPSSTATNGKSKAKRFQSSESAIRLQELRNSHPCVGWSDEEEDINHNHQELQKLLNSDNPIPHEDIESTSAHGHGHGQVPSPSPSPSLSSSPSPAPSPIPIPIPSGSQSQSQSQSFQPHEYTDANHDIYRIKGYKDFSNGPLTALVAILVWGFVTLLNIYLLASMLLGYDVPF